MIVEKRFCNGCGEEMEQPLDENTIIFFKVQNIFIAGFHINEPLDEIACHNRECLDKFLDKISIPDYGPGH